MKKVLLFVALLVLGLGTAMAASGINWDQYEWLGNGSGNEAYTNKIKVQKVDELVDIVNLQHPGFASEAGIYLTTKSGISSCSVSSDIQGAGIILHLSAFTDKETQVEITNATDGTFSFWVYYEDGAEEPAGPVAVEGVSLPATAEVTVGKTVTLEPVFTPTRPTNKTVTWTTSDATVATVDNGVVAGVAAGTATITVTTEDGGFTAECVVTVSEAAKMTAAPYDIDPAAEIIPIYVDNNNALGLNINPYWGQATVMTEVEIDGNKTLSMTNTNYQGIDFTAFSFEGTKYLHFEVYPVDCNSIRITPIIWNMTTNSGYVPEQPRACNGLTPNAWNTVNIPIEGFEPYEYMVAQIKFDEGNGNSYFVDNICFIKDPGNTPSITAKAQNVTFNSAEIAYELKVPELIADAEIKVYVDGVEATANPHVLTGLTEHTEYNIDVYAVAILGGETFEGDHVTVNFTTPYENAVDKVFCDYVKAEFKNAFLVGETEASRRTIGLSLPFKLTYDTDGNLRYEIDLTQAADIVGLVPQIYWWGFRSLTEGENHVWSYDFGPQEEGSAIAISHYLAYSGGVVDINFGALYGTVGLEQECPAIGEAASLAVSASKTLLGQGDEFTVSTLAKDAAGYFVAADAVEYDIPAGITFNNGACKATGDKGEYAIKATIGALTAQTTVNVAWSEGCTNLASGIAGTTDEENLIEGTSTANATDGNLGTELRWGCSTTEEHYLTIDLGDKYDVEAVHLVFEGAYATEFEVVLGNEAPASRAGETTFTVTNGNTTDHIFTLDTPEACRYVTVNTSKALNAGWGIKIKEIEVYGKAATTGHTVAITSAGICTFAPSVDVEVPAGVEVWVLESADKIGEEEIVLTKAEVTMIPAGTGVILVGEEGEYEFAPATGAGELTSLLVGNLVEKSFAPGEAYILGNGNHGIGFYLTSGGTLAANKAYLPVSPKTSAPALRLNFDGTTSIQNVWIEADSTDAQYNVLGQKVGNGYKGFVVKNGRKMIVK